MNEVLQLGATALAVVVCISNPGWVIAFVAVSAAVAYATQTES